MRRPNERLAGALRALKSLQDDGLQVFKGSEVGEGYLGILLEAGYAQRIMKGWYHLSMPDAREGDTTSWAMNFWKFVSRYCGDRFGDEWHLSPEASMLWHVETRRPPRQIVVHSPWGGNNNQPLPHGYALYDLRSELAPQDQRMISPDGARILTPEGTVLRITENTYASAPGEVAALLGMLSPLDTLIRLILDGSQPVVGGRVVGAMRHVGMTEQADRIEQTMRRFRMPVRVTNPFEGPVPAIIPGRSAISNRLRSAWAKMAPDVQAIMPRPEARSMADVLDQVNDRYRQDAYHSLSIEGYRVTEGLIEQIQTGEWNPEDDPGARQARDALAAKGYWDAFQAVVGFVKGRMEDGPPPPIGQAQDHWFQSLFMPSVNAGILKPHQLIGFRNHPVYIRTAEHVPPRAEALPDAMETYCELLEGEPDHAVKAVLGHWMFGYIHPYPDGNGRIARFTMNAMLVTGGYDWTIIRVEDRARYMKALDEASVNENIAPFATLIADYLRSEPKGHGNDDGPR